MKKKKLEVVSAIGDIEDLEIGMPMTESTLFRFKKNTDVVLKTKKKELNLVKRGKTIVGEGGKFETINTVKNSINKLTFYKNVLENLKVI